MTCLTVKPEAEMPVLIPRVGVGVPKGQYLGHNWGQETSCASGTNPGLVILQGSLPPTHTLLALVPSQALPVLLRTLVHTLLLPLSVVLS